MRTSDGVIRGEGSQRQSVLRDGPGKDLHGAVYPAEVRSQERFRVRVKRSSGDVFSEGRVWRISPLGIEIGSPSIDYEVGSVVDLEIVLGGHRAEFSGVVVSVDPGPEGDILGVRFSYLDAERSAREERRTAGRWNCSELYYPTCVFPSPSHFDDWIYGQIRDVSQTGFQFDCSLRNKYLIPGLRLQGSIVIPMGGSLLVSADVVHIGVTSTTRGDRLLVGCRFVTLSKHARRLLGQYLIQFSDANSLRDLVASGFAVQSVAAGTSFYYLQSQDDYAKVLELRLKANRRAGQLLGVTDPSFSAERDDGSARILVGRRGDQVIATWRIRFPGLDEKLEAERFGAWSSELPRRDQIFEGSRLCTDPDYRGNDLLLGLFRFALTNVVGPERPWLVTSAMSKYIPFYSKLGLKDTGKRYTDPVWTDELCVLMLNTFDVLRGVGVSPIYWNLVYRDSCDLFVESNLLELNGLDKARLFFYRAFGPVARLLRRFMS